MRLAIVADDVSRKEVEKRLVDVKHSIVWAVRVDELVGKFDAIWDLRDEDLIKRELFLLKRYKCPLFIQAVHFRLYDNDTVIVRVNGWPGFLLRDKLELAAPEAHKALATKLLDELGWEHFWSPDVIGMVTPRIIATLVNEAYYALGDGVSGKGEIDIAMRLGTNYPKGPFEWSEQIGIKNIFVLLSKLSEYDIRYIPAPQLIYESGNGWD